MPHTQYTRAATSSSVTTPQKAFTARSTSRFTPMISVKKIPKRPPVSCNNSTQGNLKLCPPCSAGHHPPHLVHLHAAIRDTFAHLRPRFAHTDTRGTRSIPTPTSSAGLRAVTSLAPNTKNNARRLPSQKSPEPSTQTRFHSVTRRRLRHTRRCGTAKYCRAENANRLLRVKIHRFRHKSMLRN